jgi:aspartate aminotransferase-like enzyme
VSDAHPIDAQTYARAERLLARLLDTTHDVLLLQGEAVLVLEAAARGLGGPGVRALNLVSGPYGQALGEWLAAGGAEVEHLGVEFDRALDADAVSAALAHKQFDVVSVVHAEAATGVVNPLQKIAAAAHESGALVLVDAVASVGAEPLPIDDWDLDLVMIGPQKTLAGPNGVCALIASERGWSQIAANPAAPRDSILSLLDWKQRWIDAGRKRVPAYVHEHEMRALIAALDDLGGDVGLRRVVERHRRAGTATRAGARTLGLDLWVADDADAASVVTLVRPPAGVAVAQLAEAASRYLGERERGLVASAPGPLADAALRINHTGAASEPAAVIVALTALAGALHGLGRAPDLDVALAAADRELFAVTSPSG